MSERKRPIVAIDGPAGAGKSTVARLLAEALGYVLVDTGAMYRAVALAATRAGVPWNDAERVAGIARGIVSTHALRFERDDKLGVRVFLKGEWANPQAETNDPIAAGEQGGQFAPDISEAIRLPEIAQGASTVSAHGEVRAVLLDLQRQAGEGGGVVLEGRDIGTVVFPDAEVKFFLTASAEVRARRRHEELVAKGQNITFDETLADVKERDARDEGRAVAPLRKAETAVLVDSTSMTIEQTVAFMLAKVREASLA
ncbi:MAG TPA: (d)CMP kinase [Labilithrix sp.]|nr:(d)CMP kinase [Labilithrix sp.]